MLLRYWAGLSPGNLQRDEALSVAYASHLQYHLKSYSSGWMAPDHAGGL